MARSVRNPEMVRLELTQGDWLLVKKRLTAGESRAIFARMVKTMNSGERIELDAMQVGRSQAVEYLIDWGTFTDAAGKPLVIRDKSATEIGAALDSLETEDYDEVVAAVRAHDEAQDAARAEEKKAATGAIASSPISLSVDA